MNKTNSMVWAEVDLDCLRHNLKEIRRTIKHSGADILAIVKADAYGHGMRPVARALQEAGVSFFGVANIEEAVELRKTCPSAKILVLGSFHAEQAARYVRERIRPTLCSDEDVRSLEKYLGTRRHFPVHIKVDTGMGRLGVWHAEAEKLFRKLVETKKIMVEGVYTHLAAADELSGRWAKDQIYCFKVLKRKILEMGVSPAYWHSANSAGLLRFSQSHLNLVRPGLLLYGLNPLGEGRPTGLKLKPALSLKTRISFLKKVPAGFPLSYGGTYRTGHPTWIATLPVGYSHGYRVGFSNKGVALVNGKKCPVVGRVTMDQTLVDVGEASKIRRWDEVTLIGQDGKSKVSAEELAALIDTIPYEIVCAIHSRIPRYYKGLRIKDKKD